MKKIIAVIALFTSFHSFAQIKTVNLQASGLTCSMCSNSINKALYTIDYVTNVKANIKSSSFEISFKPDAKIDFDLLKKKVEDAGFHVAKLTAVVNFDNQKVENDKHINFNGIVLHFLHVTEQQLNGEKTIQVLDKGFVSSKDFKKNSLYTKMDCYKTGVAGSCCTKSGLAAGSRIYHVTI